MLDDNGYWVPDDPYLQQMNRQMSASGGVEPAQPEPQTNLDDYPGSPDKMGLPASPPPSPAQQTLKDRYGIGTFGSAADAAKRAAEAYRGGVDQYESATHQGMPQQYGTAEPTGQDNGPLDPAQAAEKYMANNPDDATAQLNNRKHTLGYGDRSSQNAAYAARTAADHKTRFESRNALREQGAMNRAASREKDADMWSQFRDMGAMQGAAPNARFNGGPMAGAQNVGGAILLPGMGAPPGGRYGQRYDPQIEYAKLDQRGKELEARTRNQQMNQMLKAHGLQLTDDGNSIKRTAVENTQNRFNTKMNSAEDEQAKALRLELDKGLALIKAREGKAHELAGSKWQEGVDEDLTPWKKFIKGPDFEKYADTDFNQVDPTTKQPGLYRQGDLGSKKDRVVMLARQLREMARKGRNVGEMAPDTIEELNRLAMERGFSE